MEMITERIQFTCFLLFSITMKLTFIKKNSKSLHMNTHVVRDISTDVNKDTCAVIINVFTLNLVE